MSRLAASVRFGMLWAAIRWAPYALAASSDQTCALDSKGNCKPINVVCDALADHQIDWDCVFGPESLEEVFQRGGDFTTCPTATKSKPCSRFIVKKDEERSEVKVQEGPEGFPFLYGEEYIFKYSFKAIEDMQVATRFTHLGQLKGSADGYMISGDPIYSLTANKHGLQVRFSNLESIEDFHPGFEEELDWEDCTGEWVHVEIITTFGKSMVVKISGAVNGRAEWPSDLKPIAWHRDSQMVRMKLGLYHSIHNVADGEVEYRDISIEGPKGIIRTSPPDNVVVDPPVCRNDQCELVDIMCGALTGNMIDWNCVFGENSLEEVNARGGSMVSCPSGSKLEPCSRFIVPKEQERAEVLIKNGSAGFEFKKGETYVFKYSFRPKDGMKVSGSSTRFGQMKGTSKGFQLKGNPLFALTATNSGINVRFSKDGTDYVEGLAGSLSWEDATGEWVDVEITTTFGKSMEVKFSGGVKGVAVWPSSYKPVAWNNDADAMMFKLGLYHIMNKVADAEVEYKNISIEGPTGVVRTSSLGVPNVGSPEGVTAVGCAKDKGNDRILSNKYSNDNMSPEMCATYCEGDDFFGLQYGVECWCGSDDDVDNLFRHGTGTCNYPCAGDGKKSCGGEYAMSLYQFGAALPVEIPDGSKFLGCYNDLVADRALSLKKTSRKDLTHEDCMDFCKDSKQSAYFAVQYGKECFCGDENEDYAKHGPGLCDMPCAGDSNLICGGELAANVFFIY
ncbi:unnamed protein product [Scytosiphon promiscuus]